MSRHPVVCTAQYISKMGNRATWSFFKVFAFILQEEMSGGWHRPTFYLVFSEQKSSVLQLDILNFDGRRLFFFFFEGALSDALLARFIIVALSVLSYNRARPKSPGAQFPKSPWAFCVSSARFRRALLSCI